MKIKKIKDTVNIDIENGDYADLEKRVFARILGGDTEPPVPHIGAAPFIPKPSLDDLLQTLAGGNTLYNLSKTTYPILAGNHEERLLEAVIEHLTDDENKAKLGDLDGS